MSLGLIETVGLIAAMEAADAAVKSANVELVGLELTKGGGMVVVKLQGDVGAINAAVQAGKSAAEKIGKVYSVKVIPRPHQELEIMIQSGEMIGFKKTPPESQNDCLPEMETEIEPETETETEIGAGAMSDESPSFQPAAEGAKTVETAPETAAPAAIPTCNMCNDVRCTRKKGEPRNLCINY
jgi:ethanolamine utilization protein EutM